MLLCFYAFMLFSDFHDLQTALPVGSLPGGAISPASAHQSASGPAPKRPTSERQRRVKAEPRAKNQGLPVLPGSHPFVILHPRNRNRKDTLCYHGFIVPSNRLMTGLPSRLPLGHSDYQPTKADHRPLWSFATVLLLLRDREIG